VPELPEVEITARLIAAATRGGTVESVLAPGLNAVKTYDPPLHSLAGATIAAIRRRGKFFLIDFDGRSERAGADADAQLTLVVHLMSAGRLQLFDKRASLRDKTARVLLRLATPDGGPDPGAGGGAAGDGGGAASDGGGAAGDGAGAASDGGGERELRLREFGTKQRAWVKLVRSDQVDAEETLAALGPEAWPDTPDGPRLRALIAQARPLYALLRDQHVIAGIGRSWVDEILHTARLSPFKRGADLGEEEAATLSAAIHDRLDGAITDYEETLSLPIPDKLPMPLTVHRRNGEPCPRCGTTLEAVFYEDYVMCYCPVCQTDGKVLKDRRLSRLLK
jgi:formamidopyrimidine-DNA glycosylase